MLCIFADSDCQAEVYFSSFQLFTTYESKVKLQNIDFVARRLKLRPLDSRFFQIKLSSSQQNRSGTSKVAPGMEVKFPARGKGEKMYCLFSRAYSQCIEKVPLSMVLQIELVVCFTPEDYRDYSTEVEIESDRGILVIPIRARRSIINPVVPEQLQFHKVPCRTSSTQPILIRNTCDCSSSFLVRASPTKFISVYPKQGVLAPGQSLQISATFNPIEAGKYIGEVKLWSSRGYMCWEARYSLASTYQSEAHRRLVSLRRFDIGFNVRVKSWGQI